MHRYALPEIGLSVRPLVAAALALLALDRCYNAVDPHQLLVDSCLQGRKHLWLNLKQRRTNNEKAAKVSKAVLVVIEDKLQVNTAFFLFFMALWRTLADF